MDDETLEVASDDECPLNDYVCLCFREAKVRGCKFFLGSELMFP